MRNKIKIALALLLSILFFLSCFMFPDSNFFGRPALATGDSKGFAVVELFTSEGCSSCPPADELMAQLQSEIKGKDIYLLAFHVDYWDRLGWKDTFSSEQSTSRQKDYRQWLNLNTIYTPQFVINGSSQFAGDQRSTLYGMVSDALQIKPLSHISLHSKTDNDSIKVYYTTDHLQSNTSVFLALIQKKATTKVARGENRGSELQHVQLVRKSVRTTMEQKKGLWSVLKPVNFKSEDWEIIGLVQDGRTGKIYAAAKVTVHRH